MWHLRCFTSAVLLLKNSHFCDILFVRASKKKAKSSKQSLALLKTLEKTYFIYVCVAQPSK